MRFRSNNKKLISQMGTVLGALQGEWPVRGWRDLERNRLLLGCASVLALEMASRDGVGLGYAPKLHSP